MRLPILGLHIVTPPVAVVQVEQDAQTVGLSRIGHVLGVGEVESATGRRNQHAQSDAVDALLLQNGHERFLLTFFIIEYLALFRFQRQRTDVCTEVEERVEGSAVKHAVGVGLDVSVGRIIVFLCSGEIAGLHAPVA